MRPSASVRGRAAISGPSMRRERKSKARLITRFLVAAELLLRRGLLAEDEVVEHLARDRPGGRAAMAAVLHQDREREPGIVGGSVGDEQPPAPVPLPDAPPLFPPPLL